MANDWKRVPGTTMAADSAGNLFKGTTASAARPAPPAPMVKATAPAPAPTKPSK